MKVDAAAALSATGEGDTVPVGVSRVLSKAVAEGRLVGTNAAAGVVPAT